MRKFEIHITGESSIIGVLSILGVKTIVVDLLKPDGELLRTEYMSSYVRDYSDFDSCLISVLDLAVPNLLALMLDK